MIVQPTSGRVLRLLSRLTAARKAYIREIDDVGYDRAYLADRSKRMLAIERKACRLFRKLVPLEDVGAAWGPMPARDNRGIWVGNVLWVLVEGDDRAGFEEGLYPVALPAIRRLAEVTTAE